MASFNRVILMGNMTRDPQLKYLPNNTAVCEFGIATNRKWRDQSGNQREDVCYVDVSAFGRQGETINQYMGKGRPILIEGRLKFDSWTAQDGGKRSKLSVVVENFQFVGSRGDQQGGAGGASYDRAAPPQGAPPAGPAPQGDDFGGPPPADDGIPF